MSKKQPTSFWFRAIATEVVAAGGILALIGSGKSSSSDDLPPPAPPTISVVQPASAPRLEIPSPWADATVLLPENPTLVDAPPALSSWRASSGQRRSGPPLINPSRR